MGWNTTVVLMNDALGDIARDPDFGKKLARAASMVNRGEPVAVSAMGHCNAATVIETHHADSTALVSVGGNMGHVQHVTFGWVHHEPAQQERMLKEWADKLGFRVVKKKEA